MLLIKNSCLLLSLLFLTPIAAQIEWEELPPHTAEHLNVIHMTQDERLIGIHQYGTALYASDDLGSTWNFLASVDELREDNFRFSGSIAERGDGTLFMIVGDFIYEIDENNQNLELFFEPDVFFPPEDFFFLDNGDIIVANINQLQRYSASGQLRVNVDIDEGSFNTVLVKGQGGIHYSHSSRGLIKFNEDLTQVEEDIAGNSVSTSGGFVVDESGYLYTISFYSHDQGVSWQPYPNGIGGIPTITNSGNLHLLGVGISGFSSTYISNDGGLSFETFPKDFEPSISFAMTFPVGSDGVAYSFENCPGELIVSENGRDNWEDRSTQLSNGKPYAFTVEAATEDLVLTEECREWIKTSRDQWESLEDEDPNNFGCDRFIARIFSLPDGSLFTDEGCRSTDGGETWTEFADGFIRIDSKININSSGIYVLEFDEIWRSYDNGETWESIVFNPQNVFIDPFDNFAISTSEHVYSLGPINSNITRLNIAGDVVDVIAPLTPSSTVRSLVASYNDDRIFFLLDNFNAAPQLMVYHEETSSRELRDLPILDPGTGGRLHVDHADNLYLMTEVSLHISPDGGDNWEDITPVHPDLNLITDMDVSWDGYIYVATLGTPILKSTTKVADGFSTLTVVTYLDENEDCSYQANETLMSGLSVRSGNRLINTNENGEAKIISFQDAIEVDMEVRTDLYEVCDFESLIQVGTGEMETLFVGVQIIEECADLSISGTTPFLRRCFDNTYYLEIFNEGTVPATNVQATLELDEFFDYLSCDFPLISQVGSRLTFDVGEIAARSFARARLTFNLSCDAELGQSHYMTANLDFENPCVQDLRTDITFECRENIGSYDPNDKSIYIDGIADADIIAEDSAIDYLIRFQNTGTDTAFTVRIEDQLSADYDLASLRPIAGSHDYDWSIDRNRTLVVQFDNILLPDSTINEPDSHGFIRFRANLNEDRPEPGAVIENTAAIFFDFNEPIITNTVASYYLCQHTSSTVEATICEGDSYEGYSESDTYVDLLQTAMGCDSVRTLVLTVLDQSDPSCLTSTHDLEDSQVEVYPMPASDLMHVSYSGQGSLQGYAMIDASGGVLQDNEAEGDSFSVDVGGMTPGIYVLRLTLEDGRRVGRRVVVQR